MHQIDTTKQLGHLIRETRKKQGLTQKQLSGVSGVGVRFIHELEQGKGSCHISKVLIVLAMLGLQVKIDGSDLP